MPLARPSAAPPIIALVDDTRDLRHQASRRDRFELGLTQRSVSTMKRHNNPEIIWVTRDQPQMSIDPTDGRTGNVRTDSGAFHPRN